MDDYISKAEFEEKVQPLLDFFGDLMESYHKSEDTFRRGEWRSKHAKLGDLNDVMKKLNGADFDIFDSSYDEYHSDDFKDMDEDEYVEKLINVLQSKIDELKGSLSDKKDECEEVPIEVESVEATIEPDEEPDEVTSDEKEKAENSEAENSEAEEKDEIAEFEEYLKKNPRAGSLK